MACCGKGAKSGDLKRTVNNLTYLNATTEPSNTMIKVKVWDIKAQEYQKDNNGKEVSKLMALHHITNYYRTKFLAEENNYAKIGQWSTIIRIVDGQGYNLCTNLCACKKGKLTISDQGTVIPIPEKPVSTDESN
jgi:hypothetical protein